MVSGKDVKELQQSALLLGGRMDVDGDHATVIGIKGIGDLPMPLVQVAEAIRAAMQSRVGAAILGFRGAIRCCVAANLDCDRVYQLVRDHGCDDEKQEG